MSGCGQWFDMRGLRQVFEHIHDPGDVEHIKVFATTDAAANGSRKTIPKAWPSNTR
jgi:hypothetical protein